MDETIITSLISGGIGLIGAIIGGILSYNGVNKQIKERRKELELEEKIQEDRSLRILTMILWNEIDYNCEYVVKQKNIIDNPSNGVAVRMKSSKNKFCFDEYNAIKYELIKNNSDLIERVIDFYNFLLSNESVSSKDYDKFVTDLLYKREMIINSIK